MAYENILHEKDGGVFGEAPGTIYREVEGVKKMEEVKEVDEVKETEGTRRWG